MRLEVTTIEIIRVVFLIILMFLPLSLVAQRYDNTVICNIYIAEVKDLQGANLSDFNNLLLEGRKTDRQPAINTRKLIPDNTDYMGIQISTFTTRGNSYLQSLITNDCLKLSVENEVRTYWDGSVGGLRTESKINIVYIPPGINDKWHVQESSR